ARAARRPLPLEGGVGGAGRGGGLRVHDPMEVGPDLEERMLGRLALEVPEFVDSAALDRIRGHTKPTAVRSPGCPSITLQRGAVRPRATKSSRHPFQAAKVSPPGQSSRVSSCFWPSVRTATTPSAGTLTTFPALRTRSATASR